MKQTKPSRPIQLEHIESIESNFFCLKVKLSFKATESLVRKANLPAAQIQTTIHTRLLSSSLVFSLSSSLSLSLSLSLCLCLTLSLSPLSVCFPNPFVFITYCLHLLLSCVHLFFFPLSSSIRPPLFLYPLCSRLDLLFQPLFGDPS